MSSTSFPASADLASASSAPACEPSPSARSNPIAAPCSPNTGQTSLFTETSEPWTPRPLLPTSHARDWKGPQGRAYKGTSLDLPAAVLLTSSAVASPVSLSVTPGSDEARKMTATSGRKWLGLFPKSDQLGLLARMLLASSQWASTSCYLTWRVWATPSRRSVFRLAPSTPRTAGIGSGLWPTAHGFSQDGRSNGPSGNELGRAVNRSLGPTPAATDGTHGGRVTPRKSREGGNLVEAVSARTLWPTSTARDWKSGKGKMQSERGRTAGPSLSEATGGSLNPDWVEWLMGFPVGWTALEPSEMPLSRRSSKQSGERS